MEIMNTIFGSKPEQNAILETKATSEKIIDGKKWVCTLVEEVDTTPEAINAKEGSAK